MRGGSRRELRLQDRGRGIGVLDGTWECGRKECGRGEGNDGGEVKQAGMQGDVTRERSQAVGGVRRGSWREMLEGTCEE